MDRKVVDNIPKNVNRHDLSCGACSNDDPMVQKVEGVAPPKQSVTFFDYYMNLTSCLSQAYPKSKVFRSNLSPAANECFDFSNHVHVDLIDCDFAVFYQGLLKDLQVVEVFLTMAILVHHNSVFSFPVFLINSLLDVFPNSYHDVAFVIVANMSM